MNLSNEQKGPVARDSRSPKNGDRVRLLSSRLVVAFDGWVTGDGRFYRAVVPALGGEGTVDVVVKPARASSYIWREIP